MSLEILMLCKILISIFAGIISGIILYTIYYMTNSIDK